jgi:hypothetical protein
MRDQLTFPIAPLYSMIFSIFFRLCLFCLEFTGVFELIVFINFGENLTIISKNNIPGYHQEHKQQILVRMSGKRKPHTMLVGM